MGVNNLGWGTFDICNNVNSIKKSTAYNSAPLFSPQASHPQLDSMKTNSMNGQTNCFELDNHEQCLPQNTNIRRDTSNKMPGHADRVSEHHRRIIYDIQKYCTMIHAHRPITKAEITLMLQGALEAEKTLLTEQEAIVRSGNFEFPSTITDSDLIKFESVDWDFTALARLRISELAVDRINEVAIRENIDPLDPDFQRLIDISKGVRVDTAPDFVPNLVPPPLRNKYRQLHQPINLAMHKNFLAGKTILLPLNILHRIEGAHFSLVHCNLEPNKLRVITDSSNAPLGTCPLNSSFVKDQAKLKWGEICNVDIKGLIIKTKLFMDANPNESFSLFKMDMADAFSLFTMHAEDVRLLGFLLTDDILQFEITGSFGKTDYPYVFNVFTKVVRREASRRVAHAVVDMYVDDIMGCSVDTHTLSNIAIIKSFIERVWGVGSVADKKTFSGTTLEWIGYDVDIIEQTVRVSTKNRAKFVRILFRVQEDVGISVKDIMRLSSYASRYVQICEVMAPYSCHLYNAILWRDNLLATVLSDDLSAEFKMTLTLWRCIISSMELRRDDKRFFRTFQSFLPLPTPQYRVEFDASLTGAGIIVSKLDRETWLPLKVLGISLDFKTILSNLKFQSSMQNTCEFIAAVIGMSVAVQFGARDGQILLCGDSKTALHWAETWKFKSGYSNNTAIVYVAIGLTHNLRFNDTFFVRGVDNVVCDKLSRGVHPSELGFDAYLFDDEVDVSILRLIELCTPPTDHTIDDNLVSRWVCASAYAESLECL